MTSDWSSTMIYRSVSIWSLEDLKHPIELQVFQEGYAFSIALLQNPTRLVVPTWASDGTKISKVYDISQIQKPINSGNNEVQYRLVDTIPWSHAVIGLSKDRVAGDFRAMPQLDPIENKDKTKERYVMVVNLKGHENNTKNEKDEKCKNSQEIKTPAEALNRIYQMNIDQMNQIRHFQIACRDEYDAIREKDVQGQLNNQYYSQFEHFRHEPDPGIRVLSNGYIIALQGRVRPLSAGGAATDHYLRVLDPETMTTTASILLGETVYEIAHVTVLPHNRILMTSIGDESKILDLNNAANPQWTRGITIDPRESKTSIRQIKTFQNMDHSNCDDFLQMSLLWKKEKMEKQRKMEELEAMRPIKKKKRTKRKLFVPKKRKNKNHTEETDDDKQKETEATEN